MWFTLTTMQAVGRITPAGVVTIFTAGISAGTYAITAGADGNLWFTEMQQSLHRPHYADWSGDGVSSASSVRLC